MFTAQFKLEITFEVFEYLPHDLEWELVYVGSAKSSSLDQVLDSALVGPVPEGRHKFLFTVDAPDPSKIPVQDLVGVTVLLLRCKYNGQEFINLGWFVSNDYEDPELKENPPVRPVIEKLTRTVQTHDLRVTSFPIKWDENQPDEYPPEPQQGEIDEADLMPLEDPDDEEKLEEEDDVAANAIDAAGDIDLEETVEDADVEPDVGTEAQEEENVYDNISSVSVEICGDVEMTDRATETSRNTSGTENVAKDDAVSKDHEVDLKGAADAPFSDVTNEPQIAN